MIHVLILVHKLLVARFRKLKSQTKNVTSSQFISSVIHDNVSFTLKTGCLVIFWLLR